jgi:hypothetical protein
MPSVTIMTGGVDFDKVFSFKLKGGCILGDLVLAFCNWFEEENKGHWVEPSIVFAASVQRNHRRT